MSKFDTLLMRLDGCRRSGVGYIAKCPAHDDRAPSLTTRETDDGRILLHCFAGCSPEAVLAAVGMTFHDIMPEPIGDYIAPVRRSFDAASVLECVAKEAVVVQIYAAAMARGKSDGFPTEQDHDRLVLASARIHEALELARARS